MKVTLTRRFTFEMAHALYGYDGPCRQIHGHSYKLYVSVCGEPCTDPTSPKLGMVMDFSDLKTIVGRLIVDRFDHALIVRRGAYDGQLLTAMRCQWSSLIEVDYQPTCENMVVDFARLIGAELPVNVELSEIKLYETENSHATFRP